MSPTDSRATAIFLEARVGFNFQEGRGFAVDPRAKTFPQLTRLLRYLHKLNVRYAAYPRRRITKSRHIRNRSDEILEKLGPALWPDFGQIHGSYPSWLLNPSKPSTSEHNAWVADYPKRLFYSDLGDRAM
jgi:hypothetical protein